MLTRAEFYRHLIKYNCEVGNFVGINRTSVNQIEIINKATGAYFYISTPIDDSMIPSKVVERACIKLGVQLPSNY